MTVDGLVTVRSSFGPQETRGRYEDEVRAHGMTIFAHINHAQGAGEVGMNLPTD
jgi:uncharacterized protein (DUF302 family)